MNLTKFAKLQLEALFRNKNIEYALLLLFVNGRCYDTQLQYQLHLPLTALQKALARLEKGGVVLSYCEDKTRLYQLNPGCPFLESLEPLLRRAYNLLPRDLKRFYYLSKEEPSSFLSNHASSQKILCEFWQRLGQISQIDFEAKSQAVGSLGWNRRGQGEVRLVKQGNNTLLFYEKGHWQDLKGNHVAFSNTFRWTLDRDTGVVALEHLRRGEDQPVFLFHLAPISNQALASVDLHVCLQDHYFGQIHFDRYGFQLHWRVIGPKKNEELGYLYR